MPSFRVKVCLMSILSKIKTIQIKCCTLNIIECRGKCSQMREYVIFLIGISATIFSLWSTVPQISKSLKSKKTDDVSKWLIISLIVGLSLWVIYGIMKGDVVIASANAIGVILNLILLSLKIKYTRM